MYLQVQMGHSSVKTTLDIYGHLLNRENPEAASMLGVSILGDDDLRNKENRATFGQ